MFEMDDFGSQVCQRCGSTEMVWSRVDPFDLEIYGEKNYSMMCQKCYDQLCDDI